MSKETLERIEPHTPAETRRCERLIRIRMLKTRLERMEKEELGKIKKLGLPVGAKLVIEDGPIQGEIKHYQQIELPKSNKALLLDHLFLLGDAYADCLKPALDMIVIREKRRTDVRLDTLVSGYEEAREYWKIEPKAVL